MGTTESTDPVTNDVLHSDNQSTLSAEAIAKAIAHHKKHHHDEPAVKAEPQKKGK
jgi:hypothetical protein